LLLVVLQDALKGMLIGNITLGPTLKGETGEACLTLVSTSKPGQPVFKNLANIRFGKQATQVPSSLAASRNASIIPPSLTSNQTTTLAFPAASLDISGEYKWLTQTSDSLHQKGLQQAWSEIQKMTGWVDGQESLDSIYSPLEIEIDSDNGFF
jgi:hypothetical protein